MWIWVAAGDAQLGAEHGLVKRDQLKTFTDSAQLLSTLGDECTRVREEGQSRADAVIAEAEAQAETIVRDAEAQAKSIIDGAHATVQSQMKEAYSQGHAEGTAKALDEWHARRLDFALERASAVEPLTQNLAKVVATAIDRIIRTESMQVLFEKCLAQVSDLLRGSTSAMLRVNENDKAAALEAVRRVPQLNSTRVMFDVVSDPSLPPGSSVFESDVGVLDASLDVQLGAIRGALDKALERLGIEDLSDNADETASHPSHHRGDSDFEDDEDDFDDDYDDEDDEL